jgi:Ca2+-binding EF-hand superfamily protein
LAHNELQNYDPVAEAFKVYDPNNTGFLDPQRLKQVLVNLGFSDISDADIRTLTETADLDQDGRISLNDFRRMLDPPQQ